MGMWVWSLASLSGLRIQHCCELWCRMRCSSDPVLLRLWCRPAVAAQIRPLAWELPYATGAALKQQQQQHFQEEITHNSLPWHNFKNNFLLIAFHKHTCFYIVTITVNLTILELSTPLFGGGSEVGLLCFLETTMPLVLGTYQHWHLWKPEVLSWGLGSRQYFFPLSFSDLPQLKLDLFLGRGWAGLKEAGPTTHPSPPAFPLLWTTWNHLIFIPESLTFLHSDVWGMEYLGWGGERLTQFSPMIHVF